MTTPRDCLGHEQPADRGSATGDVRAKYQEDAHAENCGSVRWARFGVGCTCSGTNRDDATPPAGRAVADEDVLRAFCDFNDWPETLTLHSSYATSNVGRDLRRVLERYEARRAARGGGAS